MTHGYIQEGDFLPTRVFCLFVLVNFLERIFRNRAARKFKRKLIDEYSNKDSDIKEVHLPSQD